MAEIGAFESLVCVAYISQNATNGTILFQSMLFAQKTFLPRSPHDSEQIHLLEFENTAVALCPHANVELTAAGLQGSGGSGGSGVHTAKRKLCPFRILFYDHL